MTETGNSLNLAHGMVLRMVLDSLRYWVEALHVDGFRFDLASTLGREPGGFEREGAFFAAIRQDPVLRTVKLIAEPWDLGKGGYQVGGFPWPFREWNDKFRDDMGAFWRRDPGLAQGVSERLLGSPVQFDHSHRPATTWINFLAAHDGFTLADTVAYNHKHNEANGEGGADGHSNNLSDNFDAEAPTEDEGIVAARARRVRSMLASLFLSQGVPMLLTGDELGQSQGGNKNAYCQDDETTCLDWEGADEGLARVVGGLARLRGAMGIAHRGFAGTNDGPQVTWWRGAMEDGDWGKTQLIAAELTTGSATAALVLNSGDSTELTLPEGDWRLRLDTSREDVLCEEAASGVVTVGWQSTLVFVRSQG